MYGPNNASHRHLFWDELVGLSSVFANNWCIAGDFKVVRFLIEKFNSSRNTRSMEMFYEVIGELELIDPPLANAQFTWSNFCEDPICYCLDRFLFSAGWEDLFNYGR